MANVEKYANSFHKVAAAIKKFQSSIQNEFGSSFEWSIDEVTKSYLSLFDRFCPYKIGDHVRLARDVNIKNSPGWEACQHFLKKGALATVHERGYEKDAFSFRVKFDAETWLDNEGEEHAMEEKHIFHFSEHALEKA